jgi:hypothetical protein
MLLKRKRLHKVIVFKGTTRRELTSLPDLAAPLKFDRSHQLVGLTAVLAESLI